MDDHDKRLVLRPPQELQRQHSEGYDGGCQLKDDARETLVTSLEEDPDLILSYNQFLDRMNSATTPAGTKIQAYMGLIILLISPHPPFILAGLICLTQRRDNLETYIPQFLRLAEAAKIPDNISGLYFRNSLNPHHASLMRHHQCNLPNDKLLDIARGMDFSQSQGYHTGQPWNNKTPGASRPHLNMTPEEYQHHIGSRLCFYCHQSGHLYKNCASCSNGTQGATISALNNASQSYPIIDTTLCYHDHEVNTVALLDSGATLNYMECSLAEKLGVPIQGNS
ncbi:hypothetical protein DSO57_1000641 [Entomophthora muscae]|uniref:Uncharacterized protein n=1 Tax=Entomophthora muscae TaxID=34485 RepID=A0ACC2S0F9_9FUNG|nr:hypothetical protein DSO57_1000641 [Entomophthora muscae]